MDEGTRYLDVALVRNNSLQTGWQAYKCLQTHISNTGNAPGNTRFWEPFGLNVNAIFTSLIIAKDAHLDLVQGNQIAIKKDDGTVTAGMSGSQAGDKTRIWAGSDNPDLAPFRVNEYGHAQMNDADIVGQFSAAGGKIILFRDGSGRLADGNIYWDAAGNIYIRGVYRTEIGGKRLEINPTNNSLRMYNENDKTVLSMMFEKYDTVSIPSIHLYDYDAAGNQLRDSKITSNGITAWGTYYGKSLGMQLSPSGLSFSENGVTTKIYPNK